MNGEPNCRRRATLAALACLLLPATGAIAQDPRAAQVQNVAREWLALADNLDAQATYKAAGPRFRQALTLQRWLESLRKQRGQRGATVQRAAASTVFAKTFPGLNDPGDYALIRFRTSFANETAGQESVTLEAGPDKTWRVIGYVIS